MEQALAHLIQNAVDASDRHASVNIDATAREGFAHLTIADSGCGMSPHFVSHGLFKPFVSSKDGGFGIGALEARELVRAMDGWLDVESREGLGTRFVVRLPLTDPAAHTSSTPKPPGPDRQWKEVA